MVLVAKQCKGTKLDVGQGTRTVERCCVGLLGECSGPVEAKPIAET
jgi:hypothetical protein